jgi:SAM-dependent methyltransferase
MNEERGEGDRSALATALRWAAGAGLTFDGLRALLIGRPIFLTPLKSRAIRQDFPRGMTERLVGVAEVVGGLALLEATPLTVPQLYHLFARIYDPTSRLWRRWLVPDVQAALDRSLREYLPAGGAILDLGCGTGANLERLHDLGLPFGSYTGVDLSPDMLAIARRKFGVLPNVRFQQLNLLTDPLPDGPFDVVVSTWVFSHLPDPGVVVERVMGRLGSGGHAIFLFLADPGSWVSLLEDLLLRPFNARAVPDEVYRRFPQLSSSETFAHGMLAMAILSAPQLGGSQSTAGGAN